MNITPAIREDYGTPDWLFELLDKEFNFTLDAAASKENALCKKFYTEKDNGFMQSWKDETVFINPPYNQKDLHSFIEKASVELMTHLTTSVLLVPLKSDQKWFNNLVINYATEIRFINGRVRFKGAIQGAQFASAVVIFQNTGGRMPLKISTIIQPKKRGK